MKKFISLGAIGVLATTLLVGCANNREVVKETTNMYDYWAMLKEAASAKTEMQEEETEIITSTENVMDEDSIIGNIAIKNYMSGKWDGSEIDFRGHKIKLAEDDGYVLLDGFICMNKTNLDIPESAYDLLDKDVAAPYSYVPKKGTYAIIDKKLVKFSRGTKIELPGNELSWDEGYTLTELGEKYPSSMILYSWPRLIYNNKDNRLYFICGDDTCVLGSDEFIVYVFDDPDYSEMRYLGKAKFDSRPQDQDMSKLEFF